MDLKLECIFALASFSFHRFSWQFPEYINHCVFSELYNAGVYH